MISKYYTSLEASEFSLPCHLGNILLDNKYKIEKLKTVFFSLFFLDPRFSTYYQEYILVILQECSEHPSRGNHLSKC